MRRPPEDKPADQALRNSEATFRAIFDQSAQFAGILATDGVVVDVNRLSVEACGFERTDVIGQRFWDCAWWSRSSSVVEVVHAACTSAARGEPFRGETPYFLADGTTRHALLTIAPVASDDGSLLCLSATATDVTERRLAQEALRASEQAVRDSKAESDRQRRVYEAILTNTPDLAYVFDLNHRFVYANEGLLAMWGRTWDDAIGKTCLELGYEPWHAAMHDREIDQVVATRQPVRGEVPFTGTFGRRVYDYIFVPVIGVNGKVEAIAGTTRDVTERKETEAERETLLASERAARADAERASLVKDEFLAMLSHELRTPLNAIVGWIQVLRREPPSPQTLSQGLAVIDRNARTQAQLNADLLDMSLVMSGRMRIDPHPVELRVVIEAAIESVRASAETQGVTLETSLSPIAGTVTGDPTRLQQIVWNLLTNAIKFTTAGGRIRVTLAQLDSEVVIAVRDTGKGISPEFLPHVFERFRQAQSSAAREHRGLGLGLAIVKQLVDIHGGRVEATSDGEGQGSTFTVRLPAGRPQSSADIHGPHLRTLPMVSVPYEPPNLDGVTVLAVDDDQDARDLVGRLLGECGARVVLAGSTQEALEAMKHEQLDVIVSDIAMPVQDGYVFMSAVRRMGITTPAVALSAFARTEDRRRSLFAGFQTHLAKPVEPAELVGIVAALTHKSAGHAPLNG
jgi:PAS domain S-box-containing protein